MKLIALSMLLGVFLLFAIGCGSSGSEPTPAAPPVAEPSQVKPSQTEMVVDSVRASVVGTQRVVVLREKDSDRALPIWIGRNEADAIALKMQNISLPRPLTHDLLGSVIASLGARVDRIIVSDLANDTFYATVVLQHDGTTTTVDARPSDAIALAVRTQAPIYAENSVLDRAAVQMDRGTGDLIFPDEGDVRQPPLN